MSEGIEQVKIVSTISVEAKNAAKASNLLERPEKGQGLDYLKRLNEWAKSNHILGTINIPGVGYFVLKNEDPYGEGEDLYIAPYWNQKSEDSKSLILEA